MEENRPIPDSLPALRFYVEQGKFSQWQEQPGTADLWVDGNFDPLRQGQIIFNWERQSDIPETAKVATDGIHCH